ncbi:MAG: UPF0058 family protein [Methanocellales archaeon]
MHKEELIHLHSLLVQIKRYFEQNGMGGDFSEYNALHISPLHIHRSKAEHKHAIFVLGTKLASLISEESSSPSRISIRMQELAEKTIAEATKAR